MAYEYKGVKCDTLEELLKLQEAERTKASSQAVRIEHAEAKDRKQTRPAKSSQKRIECDHRYVYDGLGGGHNEQYVHKCSKCGDSNWFSEPHR